MPEVIDLVSSTPPLPSNPLATPSRLSSPPRPSHADNIEDSLFAYDDIDNDKPAKRRRVSNSFRREHATKSTRDIFLFSDEEDLPPAGGPSKRKSALWNDEEESDPIVFTSSAPDPARGYSRLQHAGCNAKESITIDDVEEDDGRGLKRDEIEEFSDQLGLPELDDMLELAGDVERKANSSFSSRTASLLARLEGQSKGGGSAGEAGRRSRKKNVFSDDLDEDDLASAKPKPTRKKSKHTTAEKEAKVRQREEAKAQRERERQAEKERKQKLKEEKAREKQLAADILEVNKLKVDKKNSTPEMIIDVSSSLEGSNVGNQTAEFMKRLGVECTFFTSEIPNLIKWRRKVVAMFNEAAGYWEPCPHYIAEEEHVLCVLTAQEFVDMVLASEDEGETLELHVAKMKSVHPACKPIYLIEGLTAWMRKNKNSRNRAYQAEILRQMEREQEPPNQPPPSTQRARSKKPNKPETTPPVDDDEIEDALLHLQVSHACLIHHTNAAPESADWIKNFTEHVSTIPYRRERMDGNDSAFCMDAGQVKTGDDKNDTFIKMLQEVNRVTASMAYGVSARYPSVTELVRAMKVHGPGLLEDVRKSANKNGALTDSRIGPAASKRLYKVFMGMDPGSTDI